MKIAGIVAEFNPFHNGHKALLDQVRQAGYTHIIAVMSGNFVQRGLPAITTKQPRVQAALENGVDLVLELPVSYATAPAQFFATGALALLQQTGVVDGIAFGSEVGTIEPLQQIAAALERPEFSQRLPFYLEQGMGFAPARASVIGDLLGPAYQEILSQPNNVLGVEYLRSSSSLNWNPQFHTFPRVGVGHHGTQKGRYASASYLRSFQGDIQKLEKYVPPSAYTVYHESVKKGLYPVQMADFEISVLSYLRRLSLEDLSTLPDLSEGLEHRLYNEIPTAETLDQLYRQVSSKRYPLSRIRRLVSAAYLGMTSADQTAPPPYLRMLGFRKEAEDLVSMISRSDSPFGYSLKKLEQTGSQAFRFSQLEQLAGDLYTFLLPKRQPKGSELTCPLVVSS